MSKPSRIFSRVGLFLVLVVSGLTLAQHSHAAASGYADWLKGNPIWSTYKQRFVGRSGNVIDNVNGGISHSESQGYGLLLAVAAGDRATFERVDAFTKSTLAVRTDALHAWRYRPNAKVKVADTNNASDGDILIAWALLEAAEAGWDESYRQRALSILQDLRPQLSEWPELGLVLSPGAHGFEPEKGALIANPSYWVFPALERIHALTGDRTWRRLQASGEQVISQFVATHKGRVPDWVLLQKGQVSATLAPDRPPRFGYEAIRVPLYLLMSDKGDKSLALEILSASKAAKQDKLQLVAIESGKSEGVFADPGYDTLLSLGRCHQKSASFPKRAATQLDKNYYPATLQLLALIAVKRSYPSCL